jgi:hypothetical protein
LSFAARLHSLWCTNNRMWDKALVVEGKRAIKWSGNSKFVDRQVFMCGGLNLLSAAVMFWRNNHYPVPSVNENPYPRFWLWSFRSSPLPCEDIFWRASIASIYFAKSKARSNFVLLVSSYACSIFFRREERFLWIIQLFGYFFFKML